MISEFYDMDKGEKIRYVSESSNASTSGYSTAGQTLGNNSPSSQFSLSPAQSPATATLQTEFSNLNLPSSSNSPNQQQHNSPHHYIQLQTAAAGIGGAIGGGMQTASSLFHVGGPQIQQQQPQHQQHYMLNNNLQYNIGIPQQQQQQPQQHTMMYANSMGTPGAATRHTGVVGAASRIKSEYPAVLEIVEQPVEKFRFRYKSEMHGTHGSLNGAKSQRTPKTFPEVQLLKYNGPAVIRCSLFQTNLDSPHSHQLVVRKDDRDVCDPHDLHVSTERGYVAQFMNMGIIHTAKKFILEELLKKKQDRLVFQLGRRELSTKQIQELHKETEKEAKDMNLNQVRLCYEAFKIEDNQMWTPIAAPVYTHPINNRKSAQTGELRIVRLSIAAGSVAGNDELILLVEKVSKKNIKVRFYEQNEDDETVWEEFAKFRESDVHHQYAIICQTPPYKNKDIDRQVEVFIELIRPSDDERSYPPLPFRYKPRDAIISRKRRRTSSTATSSSGTGSATSSLELPRTVEEQAAAVLPMAGGGGGNAAGPFNFGLTISEEFNKNDQLKELIGSQVFANAIIPNSEELQKICPENFPSVDLMDFMTQSMNDSGMLQKDSVRSVSASRQQLLQKLATNSSTTTTTTAAALTTTSDKISYLQRIFRINDTVRYGKGTLAPEVFDTTAKRIRDLFLEHADRNSNGDTLLHEIISQKMDNVKSAIKLFEIFTYFKLHDLVAQVNNADNESVLHCACLHDRAHYIRPLLGLQCNPNTQDHNNNTALHIAVKEEHTKCIDCMLNANNARVDISLKNDQGLTPLHLALIQNNFDVAKKLIKYDCNAINVCNKDGNNALHLAVLQQNEELVVLILDAQKVEDILVARNTSNHTALELAKQLNSKIIVQQLEPLYKHLPLEPITIKEEVESSSTEDDEESNEAMDTQDSCSEHAMVFIKNEIIKDGDDDDIDNEAANAEFLLNMKATRNLKELLDDTKTFKELVTLLDKKVGQKPKWKQLAEISKMHHLVFLWTNAEAMLNYVKTKSKNENGFELTTFARALGEVDPKALELLERYN